MLSALVLADLGSAFGYSAWCDRKVRGMAAPGRVDAAIVFYGGDPAVDRARVDAVLAAWRAGEAPRLHFVGGARSWGSGAARMAAEAVSGGAPASIVSHDRRSFDTETNVAEACAAMQAAGWHRVALASDAMHIVRIHWLLRRSACRNAEFAALPTPARGLGETWGRAHHEGAAWAAYALLPGEARLWLLRRSRR